MYREKKKKNKRNILASKPGLFARGKYGIIMGFLQSISLQKTAAGGFAVLMAPSRERVCDFSMLAIFANRYAEWVVMFTVYEG